MLVKARLAPAWWAALAASVLIMLGALGPALLARPEITGDGPRIGRSATLAVEASDSQPFFPNLQTDTLQPLILLVALALLAVLIGLSAAGLVFAVRFLLTLRRAAPIDEERAITHQLTAAPQLSIDALRAARNALADLQGQTSDRVIAMWIELERAAATAGSARRAAVTPAAWATTRLVAAGAPQAATNELVQLYYRARFRPATLSDEETIATAERALGEILEAVR